MIYDRGSHNFSPPLEKTTKTAVSYERGIFFFFPSFFSSLLFFFFSNKLEHKNESTTIAGYSEPGLASFPPRLSPPLLRSPPPLSKRGRCRSTPCLTPEDRSLIFYTGRRRSSPLSPAPSTRVIKDARAKSCVGAKPAQEFTLPRRKTLPREYIVARGEHGRSMFVA